VLKPKVAALRLFFDGLLQNCRNGFIGTAVSQRCFDVYFFIGKQAGPKFAVRCKPQPIAFLTKMLAESGNNTDFSQGAIEVVSAGRPVKVGFRYGNKRP
jgi:hypothetical protein